MATAMADGNKTERAAAMVDGNCNGNGQRQRRDLGRMANLKLIDKQGKELVELKLQVLA